MNPRLGQCVIAASIGVLSFQSSFADAQTDNLSSIVGVYQGQIESITMVKVETVFFLDSSNNVVGRYRYQDQGSWDDGTLFDIRLGRGVSCGVGRANSTDVAQGMIADEEDNEFSSSMLGAAGKAKRKRRSHLRAKGELCITGVWRDSYGEGVVQLRFNPTRDYFSGYYWAGSNEKAVWNGANIP